MPKFLVIGIAALEYNDEYYTANDGITLSSIEIAPADSPEAINAAKDKLAAAMVDDFGLGQMRMLTEDSDFECDSCDADIDYYKGCKCSVEIQRQKCMDIARTYISVVERDI